MSHKSTYGPYKSRVPEGPKLEVLKAHEHGTRTMDLLGGLNGRGMPMVIELGKRPMPKDLDLGPNPPDFAELYFGWSGDMKKETDFQGAQAARIRGRARSTAAALAVEASGCGWCAVVGVLRARASATCCCGDEQVARPCASTCARRRPGQQA